MATLTVLAGPNGAGKTLLINRFKKLGYLPNVTLNLDQIPEQLYGNLSGNVYNAEKELRKLRHEFFFNQCKLAVQKQIDFAYECNLRQDQIAQVKLFEDAGYKIKLLYIYLKSLSISKNRVEYRLNIQKGLDIPTSRIEENYYEGLKNLNQSYAHWNELLIFDNSRDLKRKFNPYLELIIREGKVYEKEIKNLPFIKEFIPNIFKLLDN